MATRSDIRDWVRQQTLVETDDFADAKLNNVINQGVRTVGALHSWPFLQAHSTVLLVDAVDTYTLPADFSRMENVYLSEADTELVETTRRRAVQDRGSNATGTPIEWYFYGANLVVTPTPTVSDVDTILDFDYVRTPTLLANDTDTPEWHSAFHMILADYAAARVWEREEDLDRANYHRSLFYRGVEGMAVHYTNRGVDTPLIVGDGRSKKVLSRLPWSGWLTV